LLNNRLNEGILSTRRKRHLQAVREGDGHTSQIAFPGDFVFEAFAAGELFIQGGRPSRRANFAE
jgi:hypothetical protein